MITDSYIHGSLENFSVYKKLSQQVVPVQNGMPSDSATPRGSRYLPSRWIVRDEHHRGWGEIFGYTISQWVVGFVGCQVIRLESKQQIRAMERQKKAMLGGKMACLDNELVKHRDAW